MLSLDLINNASALLNEFDAAEPLFSGLHLLSKTERDLDVHLNAMAAGGQGINTAAVNAHNHLAAARKVLPQISSRFFFRALDQSAAAISHYASYNAENSQIVESLHERLEDFSKHFEAFLSDQSGVRALPVLRGATPLLVELKVLRRTLTGIVAQLTNDTTLVDDEEVFSIVFPDEQSLDEIAAKLVALKAIFDLVASLINAPTNENVRVLRLEYGSFWAELAVTRAILKVARPWINALAGFFYRTRTVEGSLSSTTTASRDAIKQVLDVRQLLQKAGLDTQRVDAELEEAGAAMAANVAALIGKQIRFKIDGTDFQATRADLNLESRIVPRLSPPSGK
jgi:hypothetical protein